ncbi:MAG: hypothetical protein V5A34_10900 [Halapricum sp.]
MADDESDWEFGADDVASEEDDGPTADREPGESEWRYSLSDLDEGDEQSAVGGNVFGSMDSDVEVVEPGEPDLENVLFVIVGALLALVFFLQFYLLTI